jgi:16S rRNA (adenine1518-N6/adenine1519-N6)-dimethyltransferase
VVIEDRADDFDDLAGLEHVTAAAFGQRRKMLRASLRGLGDAEALLAIVGINPTARPETVSPEGFFALTRAWRNHK